MRLSYLMHGESTFRAGRPSSRGGAAVLALTVAVSMSLGGCNIDWLDVFDPDSDNDNASDTTAAIEDTDIPGLNVAASDFSYANTFNTLGANIDNRLPYRSFNVNFQSRADDDGPDIRPTGVIFYYNADLITPLTVADPRAGLDLPPAVLVYQTDDDSGSNTIDNGTNSGIGIGTGTTIGTGVGNTIGSGAATGVGSGTGASAGFGSGTGASAGTGSGTGASAGFGSGTGASSGFGDGTGASPSVGTASGNETTGDALPIADDDTGTSSDGQDNIGIAYNSADYLAARYDLDDASDTLDAYEDDLSRLASNTAGNSVSVTGSADDIDPGEGIERTTSDVGFQATVNNLQAAIDARDDVVLLAQFDHRAAAASVGTMLTDNNDPAILFVIDATNLVSRLIAGGQTVAVDLPIRILVSRDEDGDVMLYHDTPAYLASRHDLDDVDEIVNNLRELLDDLIDRAAG